MDVRCMLVWSVITASFMFGQCCMVDQNWSEKSIYDLLDMADIVVYGRDTEHVDRTGVHIASTISNVTDCLFQVYCVLKGNITKRDIIIEQISPLSACSGSREMLDVGMEKIVALKMANSGNYKYYEGNALQSSVYESDVDHFRTMASVVKIRDWRSPLGAEEGTCQVALANMTIENVTANVKTNVTTNVTTKLPKATTTIPTKTTSQATTPATFTTTTQAKESAAKVAANLESDNSADSPTGLSLHLFLFPVLATAVIN